MKWSNYLLTFALLMFAGLLFAQDEAEANTSEDKGLSASMFSGLKLRNVGPAFTSGRISDIAIHPDDENTWYVAVGSGGIWMTDNAGITWSTIFDNQPVYSIGCLTFDPSNPHTIWVGTGENVGGRHVGYGDGVYVSHDGGASWKNKGLKASEHISRIIVHPDNSDVIWVAAQGPLWSSGGERGLYKSVDGGGSWNKVLGDSIWTGVTDIVVDPRNPDVMYAATWDRHRTVAAYMGGGPGTGLHKSTDGGETWSKLKSGLPRSNMGKIGLAISPQNPDVLYAAIELDRRTGGVYRSSNRGASWTKMSSTVSGGTGPHYYQELYASPHNFDHIYLMDVRIQESRDGGKNFSRLPYSGSHSDNHAIAFRADDPDYMLVGSDGGLYETYDGGSNYRFIDNMPITQYYKVAVNDQEPFYHIFGGTQDNGSHGGPSQTDNYHGIRNADWYKTLGADGHQSATEPGNNNIIYAETQQGGLHRIDLSTGEQVSIQPQPGEGEAYERYNWDAPIVVSPHSPSRIYFASQRVWRSDNRGDSWTAISDDLTRNEERFALPIMGRQQSWDNSWDVLAMSNYNSITSLSESPLQEGLLYAGTDDGIIQVSEDGGDNWTKIEASSLPGVPERAFVNDIRADLHDASTVYVALDNHKEGDFTPYLLKSTDKGATWTSIAGDIPDRTLVWRLVQDHVDPELMFIATEFGIYFTIEGGNKWMKVAGAPTISFRDLVIQRRENDLVCASFGRSFFVLDDYSPLRNISEDSFGETAMLFQPMDADWYVRRSVVSSQGSAKYQADNPPYGAVFTYYLPQAGKSSKAERKETEKARNKANEDVEFPGWDALAAEKNELGPKYFVEIYDAEGNVVSRVAAKGGKGVKRVSWGLRHASRRPVSLESSSGRGRGAGSGALVTPGEYSAKLIRVDNGISETLSDVVKFNVVPLREGELPGASPEELIAYRKEVEALQTDVTMANYLLDNSKKKLTAMQTALLRAENSAPDIASQLHQLRADLLVIEEQMRGNPAKSEVGEKNNPTVQSRMWTAYRGLSTTYGPTELNRSSLAIATNQLAALLPQLEEIHSSRIPQIEEALRNAGAPWIIGTPLGDKN